MRLHKEETLPRRRNVATNPKGRYASHRACHLIKEMKMIGKLEFDLNDPDDVSDWKVHCKAFDTSIVLSEIVSMLRGNMKYDLKKSAVDLYTECWELCQDYGIDPWEV
jgi:hypothetical protein